MSCCAFPPPSKEPLYSMHPMLAHLLAGWDRAYPGVHGEVAQAIGLGNMDREDWDMQEGMPVIPYQVEEQFSVALATIEQRFLQQEERRLLKSGPWCVRWGFSKPRPVLNEEDAAWLTRARAEAENTLRQVQAMTCWKAVE